VCAIGRARTGRFRVQRVQRVQDDGFEGKVVTGARRTLRGRLINKRSFHPAFRTSWRNLEPRCHAGLSAWERMAAYAIRRKW
jgi:hypothetical protein